MVVDSGIHLFEWAREQAAADMDESGVITPSELDEMVDRIAILPGQLTAYDFGALASLLLAWSNYCAHTQPQWLEKANKGQD
jgi:uncharacterized protein (DUF885 family)